MTSNTAPNQDHSDEELLELLREAGHDPFGPTQSEYEAESPPDAPTSKTVSRRFDGWKEAVREAGLIPRNKPSNAEIVKQLEAVGGDRAPYQDEFDAHPHTVSVQTVKKRFDNGWKGAMKQAGYEVTRGPRSETSKEQIIEEIQMLSDGDMTPSSQEFDEHDDTVAKNTVQLYFDRWNEAVRAADRVPRRITDVTREDIINSMQMLATDGRAPTADQFDEHPDTPTRGAVMDHFDKYNDAVEAAGLEPNTRGSDRVATETMIDHIKRLSDGDTPPTQAAFDDDPETPCTAANVAHRFDDGWRGAVKQAGCQPR
jgi:hypothetical protein